MQPAAVGREAAEDDLGHRRRSRQSVNDGSDRNTGGTIRGKAIDAGRNCRKGDRCEAVLLAQFDRAAVAGGKQVVLAERAAIPHRSNRVDHVSGGKPIAFGDLGIAGLAAVKHPAFGNEVRPRRPMYRAIDTAPAKER